MDRRQFVRRLMLAGVSLSAAMVYAEALRSPPADAHQEMADPCCARPREHGKGPKLCR
jgi:hypothetical protein